MILRPERPTRTPLADLAATIDATSSGDLAATSVTGLTLSSMRVAPGDIYAALPGASRHGAEFAADAVAAGAVAVLTDAQGSARLSGIGVPVLVVPEPRRIVGSLAARVYGDPGRDLDLLAVTGTQGKTTTTRLLESALGNAGTTTAAIGTIGTRIAGVDVKTELTTPEAPDLQALFAVMRERGVHACAMEVSSHALVMGRVDGTVFDVAGFANLGRDHLDFHHSVEEYFAAKATLFTPEHARRGVTNIDDEHGRLLLERASIPMTTFSAAGADADWRATDVRVGTAGSSFTLVGPRGLEVQVEVPVPGDFNVANALCALAIAGEAGYDVSTIAAGLATAGGVPGRLERVDAGQDFLAVVDYAHKPEALEAVLGTVRALTSGRVILVVGAGGDRDTGKRTLMGEIGARLADVLVITDDNPRSEDPASIRAAILDGAHGGSAELAELGDRRTAIRHAVSLARPGDAVIVAGKGHETGQEIGAGPDKRVLPFDDRVELRAALEELR